MDSFYLGISITAVLTLIIVLTVIGLMARQIRKKVVFPPTSAKCPDYWLTSSDGKSCVIPVGMNNENINLGAYTTDTNKYRGMPTSVTPGVDADNNKILDFHSPDWEFKNFRSPNRIAFIKDPSCVLTAWSTLNGIQWDGISNLNSCQGSVLRGPMFSLYPATPKPTIPACSAPVAVA